MLFRSEASQKMFDNLVNSGELTDAERAVVLDYQHNSAPYTGRWKNVPVNQEKRQALNNIIKKYNLDVSGSNAIATRKFNPTNNSLGADWVNGKLNFGDRPTSFSAGIGSNYSSGSVDRLVIPNRYLKGMGSNFIANQYTPVSEDVLNLLGKDDGTISGVHQFSKGIGTTNKLINDERELLGTGLD